jgi:hypothetical protein
MREAEQCRKQRWQLAAAGILVLALLDNPIDWPANDRATEVYMSCRVCRSFKGSSASTAGENRIHAEDSR